MAAAYLSPGTNYLLNCLSESQRQWLLRHSTPVELVFGEVLSTTDQPIRYVYFPLTSIFSLLVEVSSERSVQMGLIGNEGMLGATLALGKVNVPMQSVVHGAGAALRIDAELFQRRLNSNLPLRRLIHRYLYVLIRQILQTGACNSSHDVKQRLARWLLMTQDRAHSDQFYLTHQNLAKMLGVRRSAVTISAGAFRRGGLISYNRGHITVLSKAGLTLASCQCYVAALPPQKNTLNTDTHDETK